MNSDDGDQLRAGLVQRLRMQGRLRDPTLAAAFASVPRHLFLPNLPFDEAYVDTAIAVKWGPRRQAISSSSQPSMMAIMLEQLALRDGHRVLEIGAGTGYNAALMAHVIGPTGTVVSLDVDEDLVQAARAHLAAAGVSSVTVVCADGMLGWPDEAPYDRIIVTAAAPDVVPAWAEQLASGGRLVAPIEVRGGQQSVAYQDVDGELRVDSRYDCTFMMLRPPADEVSP